MLKYGENAARLLSQRLFAPGYLANGAALAAAAASTDLDDGVVSFCGDSSRWRYSVASTATDTSGLLALSPADSPSAGRWLRDDDVIDLKIPITFATADAAVLVTIPAGFNLRVTRALWEVTTGWTGGTSSAIGLSSSDAAYNTKGDLLGGAGGDVAATLVAGYHGTVGAKLASGGLVVLVPGDTIRFDRIASAFTAGAGNAHILVEPLS